MFTNSYYLHHDRTDIYAIMVDNKRVCMRKINWNTGQFNLWTHLDDLGNRLRIYHLAKNSKQFIFHKSSIKPNRTCLVLYDYMDNVRLSSTRITQMNDVQFYDHTQLCGFKYTTNPNANQYFAYWWPDSRKLPIYHRCQLHDMVRANSDVAFFVIELRIKQSVDKLAQLILECLKPWIWIVDLQKIVALYI